MNIYALVFFFPCLAISQLERQRLVFLQEQPATLSATSLLASDFSSSDRRPGVGQGIWLGLKSLTVGVLEGVLGLFAQPILEVQESGSVWALPSGLGKGFVGAIAKPLRSFIFFLLCLSSVTMYCFTLLCFVVVHLT